jgi:hypothetical protein
MTHDERERGSLCKLCHVSGIPTFFGQCLPYCTVLDVKKHQIRLIFTRNQLTLKLKSHLRATSAEEESERL